MTLTRSKDRKVTNAVTAGGNVAIANTFGLPSGTSYSCPGATSFCERICYAGKLETIYSGVKNVLVRNFEALLYADYLNGIDGMAALLSAMVKDFISDCDKRGASYDFRIHWDGDFFSLDYAAAWREVIEYFPHVNFWVYTRSFTPEMNVIPLLVGLPSLKVYLSADNVNRERAVIVKAMYPEVNIAYVDSTFSEGRKALPLAYKCPENGGRIPLISDKGSACIRCGICVKGRGDVLFSASKK